MTQATAPTKLDFRPVTPTDKALYDKYMPDSYERGCEFSFSNIYLWGRQYITEEHGQILLFSQFDRKSVYPFPVGYGDKKSAIDAIIDDAHARGIPCRITGLSGSAREELEALFPNRFRYHCDESSFDYVYDINDLADLSGKKYHAKRNHLNRFKESYPDFRAEPLTSKNLPKAKQMTDEWYEERIKEAPDSDFHMERAALERAYRHYGELGMEGIMLLDGNDTVLAVTMGSRLSADTFDIQFEKARASIQGAYPAINREFARYIREKHPDIRYLDREDDMGLEGLRRAKQSYYPHHMVRKCWACLLEDGYDY